MMSFSKDVDVTPQPGFDGHRQMLLYCNSPVRSLGPTVPLYPNMRSMRVLFCSQGLAPKLSYYLVRRTTHPRS